MIIVATAHPDPTDCRCRPFDVLAPAMRTGIAYQLLDTFWSVGF
jgi:hypothetical protein